MSVEEVFAPAPHLSSDEDANEEEDNDYFFEEEYLESTFAVLIEMDVKCSSVGCFCESISDSIETNRYDNNKVLSCYGVRRVPDPKVTLPYGIDNYPLTSTASTAGPNFLLKTVCTNMKDFEASLSDKKSFETFHQYLNKSMFKHFPKFSFWDRYNGEYCVTNDPPIGDGKFFMMLNLKVDLSDNVRKENRKRHHSLATFVQQKRQKQVDGTSCNGREEEEPPAPAYAEVLVLASAFTEIAKKTMIEECCDCLKYDVLVPNGPERANEVLIWASWTDIDAYIHHAKQSYANLANIECINGPNVEKSISFWEREIGGCFSRNALKVR